MTTSKENQNKDDSKRIPDPGIILDEIAEAVKNAERSFNASKAAVADALEQGKISAERLYTRSRRQAESYIDDAAYQVKRNPWAAISLAFSIGAVVGLLVGSQLSRPSDRDA